MDLFSEIEITIMSETLETTDTKEYTEVEAENQEVETE